MGDSIDNISSDRSRDSLGDALSSVGPVVHEEELDILRVVDNKSLVAGRHHVLGLLVAAIADLSLSAWSSLHFPLGIRTEGIAGTLLKRLRTALSIPLGLRQAGETHLKRSDWWRRNCFVPVVAVRSLSLSVAGTDCRARRTLLHDGDVLLCERHLYQLLEKRMSGEGVSGLPCRLSGSR